MDFKQLRIENKREALQRPSGIPKRGFAAVEIMGQTTLYDLRSIPDYRNRFTGWINQNHDDDVIVQIG